MRTLLQIVRNLSEVVKTVLEDVRAVLKNVNTVLVNVMTVFENVKILLNVKSGALVASFVSFGESVRAFEEAALTASVTTRERETEVTGRYSIL